MGPTDVTFTPRLLNTHVTALSAKENFVFVGEGQYCHAHDVARGRQVASTQVFRAAAVHGLRVRLSPGHGALAWLLLVHGQKSLAVLLFHAAQEKFFVLMEEGCVEDWIVDAGLEKDLSHVVVATSHNSLLRCEIADLTECCRNLSEQTSDRESGCSMPGQSHISLNERQSPLGTQDSKTTRMLSVLHPSGRNGKLSVVARADCVERCVLFCGHLVMMSGVWESAVMMAGTMALQVVLWGPWGARNSGGKALPLHCLLGHQGSIFSITFCSSQGLIATTSDDRSLRVWEVRHEASTLPITNPEEEREYWRSATITEKLACYGHRARVWRSLILPSWLVSVGEDSLVCVWEHSGALAASWRAHDGASIWSVAACEDPSDRLITGGGDGSVKSWCLSTVTPVSAESMSELPWSDGPPSADRGLEECVLPSKDCSGVISDPVSYDITPSSSTVAWDIPEPHALFEGSPPGIPALKEEPSSAMMTMDFPRCISLVGDSMILVITNNGKLYSHKPETSWCLEYEDERLKNYAILETSPDSRHVAVGSLSGTVVVLKVAEGRSVVAEVEAVGSSGKVFALQWLTVDRIIVLGTAGLMTTWEIQTQDKGAAVAVGTHHLPVTMHRWLCAVYVPPTTTPTAPHHLICGDRAGSLHLYTLHEAKAQDSLRGVHGRNGVTSLLCGQGGVVYSSGRDGYVRSLRVCEGGLLPLTVTRVTGANWISKLITVQGKLLAVCFHGVKLKLWNVEEEQTLLEVECGGAHRSWDLHVCGARGWLVCAFLKDGLPYTFSTSITDKLLPLIRVLLQQREETVFVTGGEDTTLRLHALQHKGQRQTLGVQRSHLSGVRALCVVEGTNSTQSDDGSVWLVSAGGRAEFKVWQCSVKECPDLARNSTCDSCFCELCAHSQGFKHSMESDSSSCRLPNVTFREVGSHMLRTGCHKTWKSQHLTLDPETRYMGATAFWVSSSQALIALASSDGLLRVFFFLYESERLREACAAECGSCVLAVARLKVAAGTILVTCSTRGQVTFWNYQAVVDWSQRHAASEDLSCTLPQPPQPQKLTCVSAHQSGVNALDFCHSTDDPSCITMATGGDDNKLSVWEIVVKEGVELTVSHQCSVFGHASQVSGLNWLSRNYLLSASIDQRLIVWNLCCRKDGDHQIDPEMFCRGSRQDKTSEEPQVLTPVGSCFTGVPDVKGITVTDGYNTNNGGLKTHVLDKRIFVYGMGFQMFDVSVGSS